MVIGYVVLSGFLYRYLHSYWCWNDCDLFRCLLYFPHSFPFVLEIKCKTVESTFHGNRRHTYLKLSKKRKKKNNPQPTVRCIIMMFGFLKKLLGVVTLPLGQVWGYGGVLWSCHSFLHNFSSLPRYFPLVWFFFSPFAKLGIKITGFAFLFFFVTVLVAAIPALNHPFVQHLAQLCAGVSYILQALLW